MLLSVAFPTVTQGFLAPVVRFRWWLTSAALLLVGCAGPFPQSTLQPRSDFARATDVLFTEILWWAAVVFVLVELVLVVTLVRFRHREGRPAPTPTHGHTIMEIAWTLAPAVILVFVAVPTVRTIFSTAGDAPADALKVEVIGHQWWWEYRYPELGIVTADEMHLPVGKPVQVAITSADVIHSFWAPALGGKRDAIPGRVNRIAFRADSVGDYSGQCAEFCGASHANMRLQVVVESQPAFQAWADAQKAAAAAPAKGSLAEQGRAVYGRSACIGCHTIQGVSPGIIGPNLTHVGSRTTLAGGIFPNDSAHLASWIADAPALKPGSIMTRMKPPLSDADIAALVAYLESLK
ncbi:MAG TPA: cytochrome c oxidase subunit II [Gemmatimonadales bacterium]|nr:cytochrome c oxidase subunit II [Gemmatimonadales bacterium]